MRTVTFAKNTPGWAAEADNKHYYKAAMYKSGPLTEAASKKFHSDLGIFPEGDAEEAQEEEVEDDAIPAAGGRGCLMWLYRRKWLIMLWMASLLLIVLGVILQQSHNDLLPAIDALARGMQFVGSCWVAWVICRVITTNILRAVEWFYFREALYLLVSIQAPFQKCLYTLIMWLVGFRTCFVWVEYVEASKSIAHYGKAVRITEKILLCIFTLTTANLLKSVLSKILFFKFYHTAHSKEVKTALEKEYYLLVLSELKERVQARNGAGGNESDEKTSGQNETEQAQTGQEQTGREQTSAHPLNHSITSHFESSPQRAPASWSGPTTNPYHSSAQLGRKSAGGKELVERALGRMHSDLEHRWWLGVFGSSRKDYDPDDLPQAPKEAFMDDAGALPATQSLLNLQLEGLKRSTTVSATCGTASKQDPSEHGKAHVAPALLIPAKREEAVQVHAHKPPSPGMGKPKHHSPLKTAVPQFYTKYKPNDRAPDLERRSVSFSDVDEYKKRKVEDGKAKLDKMKSTIKPEMLNQLAMLSQMPLEHHSHSSSNGRQQIHVAMPGEAGGKAKPITVPAVELERVRRRIYFKTFTALLQRYTEISEDEEQANLKEARRYGTALFYNIRDKDSTAPKTLWAAWSLVLGWSCG